MTISHKHLYSLLIKTNNHGHGAHDILREINDVIIIGITILYAASKL